MKSKQIAGDKLLGRMPQAQPAKPEANLQSGTMLPATSEPKEASLTHQLPPLPERGTTESALDSPLTNVPLHYPTLELALDELKAAAERFQLIFEYAPDAYYLNDLHGVLVDGNKAAEELTGYSREELRGKSFLHLNLLLPEDLGRAAANLIRSSLGEPTGPEEFVIQRKDGTRFVAEIRSYPMRIQGKVLALGIARDISLRKRAERESAALAAIVRSADDAIIGVSLEGLVASWNDAASRLYGYTAEEIIGKPISVLIPADDALETARAHKRVLCGERIAQFETVRLHRTGKRINVSISAAPTRDLAGHITGSSAIVRDITEHKKAEARSAVFADLGLALSAARTPRQAGEVILHAADQLIGWDACSLDLYDAEAGTLHHVLTMDLVRGVRTQCKPAYVDLKPDGLALRCIKGESVLVRDRASLPTDAVTVPFGDTQRRSACILFVPITYEGKVIGLFSLHSYMPGAYNETSLKLLEKLAEHCGGALERIRSRDALLESELSYRALVEFSPNAIFVHDQQRFLYANPATLTLLGLKPGHEILERSIFHFVAPENQNEYKQLLQEGFVSGFALVAQQMLKEDGSRIEVELTGAPVTYRGRPAVQVILMDVTRRKHLEAQLMRAQRLESVGQLASGIAHDLNNVLTPIMMSVQMLQEACAQEPASSMLHTLETCTRRGADIIKQVLLFARGSEGTKVLVHPKNLLQEMAQIARETFPRNIAVKVDFAPGTMAIQGCPTQLQQVLMNLSVNARDAMPEGGTLSLSTRNAEVDEPTARAHPGARPGQYVTIRVADTGVGITTDVMDKLFDPFFTTKPTGKGTGLGLPTSLGIVQSHGGFIDVQSKPGEGSVFSVYLPASKQLDAHPGSSLPCSPPLGSGEHILVVDDEQSICELIRSVLQDSGYQVQTAFSGEKALELCRLPHTRFSAAITDLMMPGLCGRALFREMKAAQPDLPIMVISGLEPELDTLKNEMPEISCTLRKPFTSQEFLFALDSLRASITRPGSS